jgi:hypothetical protein
MMRSLAKIAIAGLVVVGSLSADIGPPTVSYLYQGTPGNYTLDFTVTNITNQDFYYFGVLLSSPAISGSPAGFGPDLLFPTQNNSGIGGSNITYNNTWVDATFSNGPPGSTVTGFLATITDASAPTSVNWFAFTDDTGGGAYTSGGNFNGAENPGFEGIAAGTPGNFPLPTPEPSYYLVLGAGALGLLAFRRMKTRQSQAL